MSPTVDDCSLLDGLWIRSGSFSPPRPSGEHVAVTLEGFHDLPAKRPPAVFGAAEESLFVIRSPGAELNCDGVTLA